MIGLNKILQTLSCSHCGRLIFSNQYRPKMNTSLVTVRAVSKMTGGSFSENRSPGGKVGKGHWNGDKNVESVLQRGKNMDIELRAFLKGWFYFYGKELRNPVIFLLIIVVRKEAGGWETLALEIERAFGRNIPGVMVYRNLMVRKQIQ